MTPERLQQIQELYHAAREQTRAARPGFLAEACRADKELRREVESLLAQDAGVMERPAMEVAAELLAGRSVGGDGDVPANLTATLDRDLRSGRRLGPYEIHTLLGAGGMGQVYRARDTRLDREVAIKVSGEPFSARFNRETRAIAALNDPHICTLYDVGPNYLVMELVEGETLAAELKKGALGLKRTLAYGAQIASALTAAHSKGITHRDLKPGNIMLTKSGVKVLDFGLAKIASANEDPLTERGAMMGTPAYMAPEQVEGKECDARTDIYALGLVLYEMATGKRPERDLPLALDATPPQFAHIVTRCLEKDPHARWQTAHDIQAELEWAGAAPAAAPPEPDSRMSRAKWVATLLCAGALAVAVVALSIGNPWRSAPALGAMRFEIPVPKEAFNPGAFTVSPDGHYFAFTAISQNGGLRRLWLRAVGSQEARPFPDIEGGGVPFWSPDSRFVAFFTPNKLVRIDIEGGPPQKVCDCSGTNGSWNKDGVILFDDLEGHLLRVLAGGGVPVVVSKMRMNFPDFFPDGRHFLYLGGPRADRIGVGSLDGKQAAPLRELATAPFAAAYAPPAGSGPGYLVFYRDETLLAQPFDPRRMEPEGDPIPMAQHLQSYGNGAFFTVSANNVLIYRVNAVIEDTRFTWFDSQGRSLGTVGEPGPHLTLSLSPRGGRAAFVRLESQTNPDSNVWLLDLARGNTIRFTSGTGSVNDAVWSSDGRDIVFSVHREGRDFVYRKAVSGGGEELLLASARAVPMSWSPDGRFLLYQTWTATTSTDLWLLPLEGDHKPVSYLTTKFPEGFGRFSPDGRWVAYQSGESGQSEIYVREFSVPTSSSAAAAAGSPVSNGGGRQPHWRADGKELFYLGANRTLMAVDITAGRAGEPRALFQLPLGAEAWDVAADGKRFLVTVPLAQSAPPPFTVVLNWQSLLRK
jgi:eukaryotic-like serine/threonine-protein kinase